MKKKRLFVVLTSALISVTVFAGCSKAAEPVKKASVTKVVSTMKGNVTVPTSPKRIVDISGSTEELLILNHTPIGTANADSYKTTEKPSYLKDKLSSSKLVGFSMMETMDMEAILKLEPDLIIMSERQTKIYEQLKAIAPVVMLKDYANDWRSKLTNISKLFGQEKDAQKWLVAYDKKAITIGNEIKKTNGTQTYLTVLASAGKYYIFSDAAIGSMLLADMKLPQPKNMPKQEGISLPVVTMEGLSSIDADHIVVIATDVDKKDLLSSSVWKSIRAVKAGNVTLLPSSPYFAQGYSPIGRELLLDSIKKEFVK
ncbi:ABC transporter substrate-binding protein [Clostridium estertheticum]|uniref:ABC transporter substrate-binding protein n=1 Tax=Clostridium estertheticum TaxID=238834 RepID=UPI001C7E0073|nr:ABC transporter substrate-binding protein [Clostridium estertheticum]MBX4260516.1 ABC transporter substrate-binding protein [Clostridium estertheticum]WLC71321.1 ABC transporter substrate-binding protein [Clostridium estertheticum]